MGWVLYTEIEGAQRDLGGSEDWPYCLGVR